MRSAWIRRRPARQPSALCPAPQHAFAWLLIALTSCRDAPLEPTRAAPSSATTAAPAATLRWHAPASWQLEKAANSGHYRAKYTVPAQGDAPHPAELLITSHGTNSNSALDEELRSLQASFEGPESHAATRDERRVNGFEVTRLEVFGTYKFPMGPRTPKLKRAPAHVLKDKWRALGAAVVAPDRSTWFFQLIGPEDTVQAARSAFVTMVEALECTGCRAPR
ncbi:MAG: hypothetical protein EXR75_16490 [Myxococcales bacterium]|nr:hypothetical protein [Myxococcales bacterium]